MDTLINVEECLMQKSVYKKTEHVIHPLAVANVSVLCGPQVKHVLHIFFEIWILIQIEFLHGAIHIGFNYLKGVPLFI